MGTRHDTLLDHGHTYQVLRSASSEVEDATTFLMIMPPLLAQREWVSVFILHAHNILTRRVKVGQLSALEIDFHRNQCTTSVNE